MTPITRTLFVVALDLLLDHFSRVKLIFQPTMKKIINALKLIDWQGDSEPDST